MKKENFVKLITAIQSDYAKWTKVSNLLFELYGEDFPQMNSGLITTIIEVIEDEFGDKSETVSWWLYDAPDGVSGDEVGHVMSDADGNDIPVRNAEELYEYLVK